MKKIISIFMIILMLLSINVYAQIDFGKEVNHDGITNYINSDGLCSALIGDEDIVWIKVSPKGYDIWFGLDNSSDIFKEGSRFWIKYLVNENNSYNDLVQDFDSSHDNNNNFSIEVGVLDENGNNIEKQAVVYIQIFNEMVRDEVSAIFKNGNLDHNSIGVCSLDCPGGNLNFAKVVLSSLDELPLTDDEKDDYSIKILLDANGGSINGNSQYIVEEFNTIGDLPVAIRDGYVFKGWYTKAIGGKYLYTNNQYYDGMTVYAQWDKEGISTIDLVNRDEGSMVSERDEIWLGYLIGRGELVIGFEGENAEVRNKQGKLLITIEPDNGKVIFADNLTTDDNISYVLTEEEKDELRQNGETDIPDKIEVIVSTNQKVKVIFDANGGIFKNDVKTIDIENIINFDYEAFEKPTRNGYRFIGFYTEDGKSYYEVMNSEAGVIKDTTFFAQWEKIYTYTFIIGKSQTFTLNQIDKYSFEIDGDYKLFSKLIISNLNLEKDVDFKVTEGSTIITFTETGLAKLNTLEVGTYDVVVEYTNDESVVGKLIIEEDKTIDDSTETDKPNVDNTETDKPNVDDSDKDNTEKENITTDNKDTNKPTGNNPQTSDNISTFVVILGIATMGIVITTKIRKHIKE